MKFYCENILIIEGLYNNNIKNIKLKFNIILRKLKLKSMTKYSYKNNVKF